MTCKKLIVLLCSLISLANPGSSAHAESTNRLAVGDDAKVSSPVQIGIAPPADFNYKTRAEIEKWRTDRAMLHADLLYYQYRPTSEIFGQITDGKPWWGLLGQTFYGPGPKSIEGNAEESRFLLNPYLLCQANFSIDKFTFDGALYPTQADLATTGMPVDCAIERAIFYAREKRVDLYYDVSKFKQDLTRFVKLPNDFGNIPFDLVAYNARDFGYRYMQVFGAQEINGVDNRIIEITQYIHTGDSCGYPGGCNNMSPFIKGLHDLTLKALPARMGIGLYKNRPSSGQSPDMTVVLNFN